MYANSYKELIVWKRAMELVKEIYSATSRMPKEEMFALVTQMRRSAVSIPSNIVEGHRRQHLNEYIQFLSIADGSAAELETQILIAKDIYPKIDFILSESKLTEVLKMLNVMISKLKTKRSIR